MTGRSLFLMSIFIFGTGGLIAQTPTVTNQDLAKYRDDRLKAEKELRENYTTLGFPSPEELAKRDEQARQKQADVLRELRSRPVEDPTGQTFTVDGRTTQVFVYERGTPYIYQTLPNFYYRTGRRDRYIPRQRYVQPGYFAGGQFWPTGPRTPSRPLINNRRNR